jgi:hypothetical protein
MNVQATDQCSNHHSVEAAFLQSGLDGLDTHHPGQKATVLTPALRARILPTTRKKPSDAPRTGVAASWRLRCVYQLRRRASCLERIGVEASPAGALPGQRRSGIEIKATDIFGLYLCPPQHAVVFCVDEKTAIQPLDRPDPVLPLSPRRAERHGSECYRHGALSLERRWTPRPARCMGKTPARHTSRDFVAFLEEVLSLCPPRSCPTARSPQQIHIILDNLRPTKPKPSEISSSSIREFSFTSRLLIPLGSTKSRSGSVKIERDVIARGIFTSVPDLARKLRRYINAVGSCDTRLWALWRLVLRVGVPWPSHLLARPVLFHQLWCFLPNISPITYDHDDLFELPASRGGR